MLLLKIKESEFAAAITNDPADRFAKTFMAKAKMLDLWGRCRGAVINDELAGAIITTYSKREPKTANLQLLHTFAKFRKRGVARELCLDSYDEAVYSGCLYYRVSAEPDAVDFYKRVGFRFLGKQKSGCQLSMFRMKPKFSEVDWMVDAHIEKQVVKRGKGGCVEIFDYIRA